MSDANRYDAIVVGGGHNGLVNGAYLAKAGLRTLILEKRHLVGGAAITEELYPGFKFTTFSYALSLLRPQIIHELELPKYGFKPLSMPTSFAPDEDGTYLLLGQDEGENMREIARLSPHDADAYKQYKHDLAEVCRAIKPLLDQVPPDPFSDDPEEAARLAELAPTSTRPRQVSAGAAPHRERRRLLDWYFRTSSSRGIWQLRDHRLQVGPRSQGSGLVLWP